MKKDAESTTKQGNKANTMLGILLPEKERLLDLLLKLQVEHKINKDDTQIYYYNGFRDGCDAIIKFISGNSA